MEVCTLLTRMLRGPARIGTAALFCIALGILHGCGADRGAADSRAASVKGKGKGAEVVPVLVATVEQKNVPLRIQAIGNVEALATVQIKSRIDGEIVEVLFKDGDSVRKGQVLFRLDAREHVAQLEQLEANLVRDRALLDRARAQELRYKDLLAKNFVSQDAYAQFKTNVDTAMAAVRAGEATLENARLQIEHATIRAPIDGRVGKTLIQLGNLVKANDTAAMVIINQLSPIYLNFAIPEQYLGQVRAGMANRNLVVTAGLPDTPGTDPVGQLTFIDNVVDTATGTVKLRATFPNTDTRLWPGQFATAVLNLGEQPNAVVVPSQAVQTGPKGQYVFVVNDQNVVSQRPIAVERIDGEQTVVSNGLNAGEKVVTVGQLRLVPGTRVNPKGSDPTSSDPKPAETKS